MRANKIICFLGIFSGLSCLGGQFILKNEGKFPIQIDYFDMFVGGRNAYKKLFSDECFNLDMDKTVVDLYFRNNSDQKIYVTSCRDGGEYKVCALSYGCSDGMTIYRKASKKASKKTSRHKKAPMSDKICYVKELNLRFINNKYLATYKKNSHLFSRFGK